MIQKTLATCLLASGLLIGCSSSVTLYTSPQAEVVERIPSRFSSIEVLTVSLPTYASGEELLVTSTDGTLVTGNTLWADDPTREITLSLARSLTEITGARVAPQPWPFDSVAEARVDVRVERLLASNGTLLLRGQYFVAATDGESPDRARLFDLSRPLSPEASLQEILAARSAVLAELAVMIARSGLR